MNNKLKLKQTTKIITTKKRANKMKKQQKKKNKNTVFSNAIKSDKLEELAEADEHEVVKELHEFYGKLFYFTLLLNFLNHFILFYYFFCLLS
jgi:hypothetical protein